MPSYMQPRRLAEDAARKRRLRDVRRPRGSSQHRACIDRNEEERIAWTGASALSTAADTTAVTTVDMSHVALVGPPVRGRVHSAEFVTRGSNLRSTGRGTSLSEKLGSGVAAGGLQNLWGAARNIFCYIRESAHGSKQILYIVREPALRHG